MTGSEGLSEEHCRAEGWGVREATDGISKEHGQCLLIDCPRKESGMTSLGSAWARGNMTTPNGREFCKHCPHCSFLNLSIIFFQAPRCCHLTFRSSDLWDASSQRCGRVHNPNPLDRLQWSQGRGLDEDKALYSLFSPFHYYTVESWIKGKSSMGAKRTSKFTQRILQIQVWISGSH